MPIDEKAGWNCLIITVAVHAFDVYSLQAFRIILSACLDNITPVAQHRNKHWTQQSTPTFLYQEQPPTLE